MTKKQAIEQSILAIAGYFEIDPLALADQRKTRGARTQNAMAAFVYHLYSCGMSYDRIGKFVAKYECQVRMYESKGRLMMRGEHKSMIDSLPKIPNTLGIVKNVRHLAPADNQTTDANGNS
jgi:hypothetical protein